MRNAPSELTGSVTAATVAQWMLRLAPVRSIQRGTIVIPATLNSNTTTITSVNTAHSYVRILGFIAAGAAVASQAERFPAVQLTNATTVTALRTTNGGAGGPVITVSYEVVERYPGLIRSLQAITVPITGSNTGTATITAVDMSKTELIWGGHTTTSSSGNADETQPYVQLTSTTQVTATRVGGGGAVTPYVTVVEWN